jgi:hypothetical protein
MNRCFRAPAWLVAVVLLGGGVLAAGRAHAQEFIDLEAPEPSSPPSVEKKKASPERTPLPPAEEKSGVARYTVPLEARKDARLQAEFLGAWVPLGGLITVELNDAPKRAHCTVGGQPVDPRIRTRSLEIPIPADPLKVNTDTSEEGPALWVECTVDGLLTPATQIAHSYGVSGGLDPLTIVSVVPERGAKPGSFLKLVMSRGFATQGLSVIFGAHTLKPGKVDGNIVSVAVPRTIDNDNPVLSIQAGREISKPFTSLKLSLPAPKRAAAPPPAMKKWYDERWIWVLSPIVGVLFALFVYLQGARARVALSVLDAERERLLVAERDRLIETRALHEGPRLSQREAPPSVPDPTPPQGLVDACAHHQCVLFAASGFGVLGGRPDPKEFLVDHVIASSVNPSLRQLKLRSDQGSIDESQLERALLLLPRDELLDKLSKQYAVDCPPPAPLSAALKAIPFRAALTTSWDNTLDVSFKGVTRLKAARVLEVASESAPGRGSLPIVALRGSAREPEGMLVTSNELASLVRTDNDLQKYVRTQFYGQTLLFVGASLFEIESLLSTFDIRERGSQTHYALVPWQEDNELLSAALAQRYGVETLFFDSSRTVDAAEAFFSELGNRLDPKAAQRNPIAARRLTRIELDNIGPFVKVALDLRPGWNVLLGNNGCGKSTVLKAVAAGLCGDDPRARLATARLLRSGAKQGSIRLYSESEVFETTLRRVADRVEVTTRQLTPLEAGSWLVMAFPAIRGATLSDPSGATAQTAQRRPVAEDVLPLLISETDHRMDDLKQWLVNIYR